MVIATFSSCIMFVHYENYIEGGLNVPNVIGKA